MRKNELQKQKYIINQVSQSESEPQATKTTNLIATLNSNVRSAKLIGWIFTGNFSEKPQHKC